MRSASAKELAFRELLLACEAQSELRQPLPALKNIWLRGDPPPTIPAEIDNLPGWNGICSMSAMV